MVLIFLGFVDCRDLSFNNLSGHVPRLPAKTFRWGLPNTFHVHLPLSRKEAGLLNSSPPSFFFCYCSIVGNPLICPTGSENDCFGTALMPMSMPLNGSEGMEFKTSPYSTLFFSVFVLYTLFWKFSLVFVFCIAVGFFLGINLCS